MSETIDTPKDRPLDREPTVSREEIMARYQQKMEDELGLPHSLPQDGITEVEASPEDYETNAKPDPRGEPPVAAQPAPEPEPEPASAPQAPPIAFTQQQPIQPQLHALSLPDGRVTYVTTEQMAQLAHTGVAAMMQPAAPAAPTPAPEAPRPVSRAPIDQDRAKEIARKIAYGTEDDGAQALIELTTSLAPQIDVETIKRQAVQEALASYQSQRDLDAVAMEFPAVAQNHRLGQMAALELHNMRADPRSAAFPPIELYREACRRTMSVVQSFAGMGQPQPEPVGSQPAPQAAPTVASNVHRLERKRAAPTTVSGTDRRLEDQATAPLTEEQSRREGFNLIKKSRGQIPA